MFDPNLKKVCKWIRTLGIDAAITHSANPQEVFATCRKEQRVLVTKAKSWSVRKDCPEHYLVKTNKHTDAQRNVIRHFNLPIDEKSMFTRCTECNGGFEDLTMDQVKAHPLCPWRIPEKNKAELANLDDDSAIPDNYQSTRFYRCAGCDKLYWFGIKTAEALAKAKQV